MAWYLLNITIITLVWAGWACIEFQVPGLDEDLHEQRHRRKIFCIIAAVNWILLSGLRGLSVGSDTLSYKNLFDQIHYRSWSSLIGEFYLKYFQHGAVTDPGYPLVEKVFQIFSQNYQLYLIFVAIIFFSCFGVFIYRRSQNQYLSYIIFSCLFYSFFAITGIRQTIATALVVFIGINLIERNRCIPFILLCLLASTIHASALCFIPFYWISKIKINKLTLGCYWVSIILSYIFRYQLLAVLQRIMGYEQYQDYEGAGIGTFVILLMLLSLFVTLFYRLFNTENFNTRVSINAVLLACFFSSLLMINQSFMRVVQYFSLFLAILLPECVNVFKPGTSRKIFTVICSIMMVGLLILNHPDYVFFWQ